MIVQYDGTRYAGWQRQDKTENTIQGKIESILSKMVGTAITINGSGRTDAGVHAIGQVINVKMNTPYAPKEIKEYMNTYLPEDIYIRKVHVVEERFHARLTAKGKQYSYCIVNHRNPNVFRRKYTYHLPNKLDIATMEKAIPYFLGTKDFAAFTSKKNSKKSTIRTIHSIEILQVEDEVRLVFQGDGFLYHMIRILMGTFIEIGYGQKRVEEIEEIFQGRDRSKAGYLVPAKGLLLEEVFY